MVWCWWKKESAHLADQPGGAEKKLARMTAAIDSVGKARIERAASRQIVVDCAEQLMCNVGPALRRAGQFQRRAERVAERMRQRCRPRALPGRSMCNRARKMRASS